MPVPLTVSEFREIEAELSQFRYGEIPVGLTLNDQLLIDFFWGHGDWRRRAKWLNQARRVRHRVLPRSEGRVDGFGSNRPVLITWQTSTPHIDNLLLPILDELGGHRCTVITGQQGAIPGLPHDVPVIDGGRGPAYHVADWWTRYRSDRSVWAKQLAGLCRRHDLPSGAFEALALGLMVGSQRIERFLQFLRRHRPSAILTEDDRQHLWSCLILAARHLGIPTATLVHGVISPSAVGSVPVLADLVICWGELDRGKLLSAGEAPEKIVIGGCPRLTRDLGVPAAVARERMGLGPGASVVLLATSPDRGYLELAELFCRSLDGMADLTGIIRLHPTENVSVYAQVARRYPKVRFMENREATLDESLAAADVVIVRGSGVGSDALIKGRLVVVLGPRSETVGHDEDLVRFAGCPRAHTAEEFSEILHRVLHDQTFREGLSDSAERYVAGFCAAFGRDSARLIAQTVGQMTERSPNPG